MFSNCFKIFWVFVSFSFSQLTLTKSTYIKVWGKDLSENEDHYAFFKDIDWQSSVGYIREKIRNFLQGRNIYLIELTYHFQKNKHGDWDWVDLISEEKTLADYCNIRGGYNHITARVILNTHPSVLLPEL